MVDVVAFLASTHSRKVHSLAEEDDDEENVDDPLPEEDEAGDRDDDNDIWNCLKLIFKLFFFMLFLK